MENNLSEKLFAVKKGNFFRVYIYENYVVKYPIHDDLSIHWIRKISKRQQKIHHIDGIPKIINYGINYIKEERATGNPLSEYNFSRDKFNNILDRRFEIINEITKNGFQLCNSNENNILYDEKYDKITLLGFEQMLKLNYGG